MTFNYISFDGKIRIPVSKNIWCGPNSELLNLDFKSEFHPDKIDKNEDGLWRYHSFLPIQKAENRVSLGEAITPLKRSIFYDREVWVKSEFLFPTGSYKDRGAAVLISKMQELGAKVVIEDSSGNAGCAIAAYSAAAGISCEIYVPEKTSEAKVFQIESYGAKVKTIQGSRLDASIAAKEAAKKIPFASHVWNPFFFEGTKTFAYEIFEQTNGNLPDHILFPVGNGTLLIGSYIGFSEMLKAGFISKIPALHIVQAANCAPLSGSKVIEKTLAEGIAVAAPARIEQIQRYCKETNGQVFTVSENDILEARKKAALVGYFIEYTSAAALAALKDISLKGSILIPFTGTGLKNPY